MNENLQKYVLPTLSDLLKSRVATLCPYYTGPFDEFEKHLLTEHEVASDIEALLKLVPEKSTVTEVGAGDGRVSVPLARHSARVNALEPSPEAASRLKDKTSDLGNLVIHCPSSGILVQMAV